MRHVKYFILASLCLLMASTSIDRDVFVVSYDRTTLNPKDIFAEIDQFADKAGFFLEKTIEELVPEKRLVVRRRKGTPYDGGVFLTLIQYESGAIMIEGVRLRGGCSKSIEIRELTVLKGEMEQHLSDKFGATIKLLSGPAEAP